MVDTVNKLKINNAKYYESNAATASDTQGDITCNLLTFTHTINENLEQNILRNWNLPVLPPEMNIRIYKGVAPIMLAPQTLLAHKTKEVVVDAASGGARVNRTLWQVK